MAGRGRRRATGEEDGRRGRIDLHKGYGGIIYFKGDIVTLFNCYFRFAISTETFVLTTTDKLNQLVSLTGTDIIMQVANIKA